MSDQAATPESTPAPESAPEQQTPEPTGPPEWLGPIEQRMNELRDQQMAIVDHLRTPQDTEDEDGEIDLEDLYTDDGQMTPELAQALIDQRVSEAMEQYVGQRDHADGLEARDYEWDRLREAIPDLQNDDYAREVAQDVAADLRAAGYESVIETPMFVTLIEREHKARKFDERAASEQPARQVVLESGQGAAPQQAKQEDWGERIVQAAERLRPKI